MRTEGAPGVRSRSNSELRLLARLVIDAEARHALVRLSEADILRLTRVSRAHGVEAWLAGCAPTDAGPWAELAEQRRRFIASRMRARALLDSFGEVAARLSCDWVAVKGQALAEAVYPRPQLRFGVDVDVLVEPTRFAEVVRALVAEGWTLLARNWLLIERSVPGQLILRAPNGLLLDLHWNLMDSPQLRHSFPFSTSALLARRWTLPSGLPTLDRADQLAHLAAHGALSGANRLIWLVDAWLSARRITSSDLINQVTTETNTANALGLVLARAEGWLGPVDPVGAALASPTWKALCRAVDLASPLVANPSSPALAASFARSVRPTAATTGLEFGRHAVAYLVGRGRPGAPRIDDPTNPASPFFERPDPAAMNRYFESAAAG